MARHIWCRYCGYFYDEALGRYGCPNCHAEGLGPREPTVTLPVNIIPVTVQEELELRIKQFTARNRLLSDPFKRALNQRWRVYFAKQLRKGKCAVTPLR